MRRESPRAWTDECERLWLRRLDGLDALFHWEMAIVGSKNRHELGASIKGLMSAGRSTDDVSAMQAGIATLARAHAVRDGVWEAFFEMDGRADAHWLVCDSDLMFQATWSCFDTIRTEPAEKARRALREQLCDRIPPGSDAFLALQEKQIAATLAWRRR